MLKAIFLFSASTERIIAFTSSPMFNTSAGLLILSLVILEIWTNPSTPGSNSTKAPKSLILTTLPNTAEPSGYFSSMLLHGSGVNALILKEILFFSLSASIIFTSIISPFF